ncbi:unnamed protein product [Cuscuta epithymum]|uniref:Uncharacterized protein n=1 Tax=Cuscuta epithymum TaxID=186058 RepID=A0AAV0ETJ2_9ASTE|nr:unnamed protein product [Cuscuta epithymum]
MEYEQEDMIFNTTASTSDPLEFDMSQQQQMHEIRESIANSIWDDYKFIMYEMSKSDISSH